MLLADKSFCLSRSESGMAKLQVVAIADTHGEHDLVQVPAGDILVHAGDFALRNNFKHLQSGLEWFASQPHAIKIFVGGNHDHAIEAKPTFKSREKQHQEEVKQQIQQYTRRRSVIYLEHQTKEIIVGERKLKVFGSPFTLWHGPGAWRYNQKEDIWKNAIQSGTDLVIVHGPPFGILDRNRHGQPCGCKHLMNRLQQVQPALAVFGHMHEGFGQQACTWPNGNTTVFANVAKGFPGQFPERKSAVVFQV